MEKAKDERFVFPKAFEFCLHLAKSSVCNSERGEDHIGALSESFGIADSFCMNSSNPVESENARLKKDSSYLSKLPSSIDGTAAWYIKNHMPKVNRTQGEYQAKTLIDQVAYDKFCVMQPWFSQFYVEDKMDLIFHFSRCWLVSRATSRFFIVTPGIHSKVFNSQLGGTIKLLIF